MSNSPKDEVCPECRGLGFVYVDMPMGCRREFVCGACGKTGSFSEALARKLSGEATTKIDPTEEEMKRMIAKIDRL